MRFAIIVDMIQWLLKAASRPAQTPEPVPPRISVRYASWLPALGGALSGMRQPAAAVTLGRTIIVHPTVELTPELLRHELAHVRQWETNPLTFWPRYVLNHVRYGYHKNPYEVEARMAEKEAVWPSR
ncbi:MAG TPA: DUF4157 domain-containing protein [Longimicrobiales bacterium]|nr:DUF4157 domain-containing protein [Longimicrobiales bacterium]